MFNGFSEETIQFFLDIRFNNNQEYFNQNKERYKQARDEFCLLIDSLSENILNIDNKIDIRPHKCLARIRRDARYYKNQDPYRDHMWFLFKRPSKERLGSPFFWFELSIEKATCGAGLWGEYKPFYDVLRENIIKDPLTLEKLLMDLQRDGYTYYSSTLKRIKVPDFIPSSLKDIYKSKSLYFSKDLDPYSIVFKKDLLPYMINEYNNLAQYYHYCRHIVDIVNKQNNQ
ncbi:MAG: DUF2461 domain-containing protein [Eubacteriales bacterium]|nr:DUF2461 domain-containing protein [Eubacteriales bacterium]